MRSHDVRHRTISWRWLRIICCNAAGQRDSPKLVAQARSGLG
jgi:hypothetical protein